jgi:cell division protein FtsX
VGTVDVSVFLRPKASASTIAALRTTIARLPDVQTVYVETAAQAHAEFERLYTCSAGVPAAAVPPSLRLVLSRIDLTRRDTLVTRLLRLHGVVTVSCDPSSPCVDAVRRASSPASPGATSSR